MSDKQQVTVVIPVYTTRFNPWEELSLRQMLRILAAHPVTVVKPRSLSLEGSFLNDDRLLTAEFDDGYFKSIADYNRLMFSAEFYRAFTGYEYILISQPDAYVFSDQLLDWCRRGYDYIGAPWLLKPVYTLPVVRQCVQLKALWCKLTGMPNRSLTDNRVGNGGFSLRRVASHLKIAVDDREFIAGLLSQKPHHTRNEDVFWGITAAERHPAFRVPSWQEALAFAFDKYPALCYRLNREQLPFAAHGWFTPRMKTFWFEKLNINEKEAGGGDKTSF